jgi:hypothetical protein
MRLATDMYRHIAVRRYLRESTARRRPFGVNDGPDGVQGVAGDVPLGSFQLDEPTEPERRRRAELVG